jgi:hypothetical protein
VPVAKPARIMARGHAGTEPYTVTTNTVEGYFSIFKRGMKGVYQHCSESICTATLPSSISATATVSGWACRISNDPGRLLKASPASD